MQGTGKGEDGLLLGLSGLRSRKVAKVEGGDMCYLDRSLSTTQLLTLYFMPVNEKQKSLTLWFGK